MTSEQSILKFALSLSSLQVRDFVAFVYVKIFIFMESSYRASLIRLETSNLRSLDSPDSNHQFCQNFKYKPTSRSRASERWTWTLSLPLPNPESRRVTASQTSFAPSLKVTQLLWTLELELCHSRAKTSGNGWGKGVATAIRLARPRLWRAREAESSISRFFKRLAIFVVVIYPEPKIRGSWEANFGASKWRH